MTPCSETMQHSAPDLAAAFAPVMPAPATGGSLLDGLASTQVWGDTTLSYAFAASAAHYTIFQDEAALAPYLGGTFRPLDGSTLADSALIEDIRRGIDAVALVTGLSLVESQWFGGDATDLRFVAMDGLFADDNGTATPGGTITELNGIADFPGDDPAIAGGFEAHVVLDSQRAQMTTAPEIGAISNRAATALHEVLHALGLAHPHDTGGGSIAWASDATGGDNVLDNDRYTVMSYERGGLESTDNTRDHGYAATPMALDLAALHRLYGARAARTGDSTYTLTDAGTAPLDLSGNEVSIGRAFAAIWDTGGVDEITYSGSRSVLINLNPATLNPEGDSADWADLLAQIQAFSLYDTLLPVATATELRADLENPGYHAGGFFSRIFDASGAAVLGGYAIASSAHAGSHVTEIENATGSGAGDVLIGNDARNLLSGRGGDDLIVAGRGGDTLEGGAGDDQMHGGAWHDRLEGGAGEDLMIGGAGDDTLTGGDGRDTLRGEAGNDTFEFLATSGNNWNELYDGGAGRDRVLLTGGDGSVFDLRGGLFTDIEEIAFAPAEPEADRVVTIRQDRLPGGGTFTLRGTSEPGATERLAIDMTGGGLDLSGLVLADWGAGGDEISVLGTDGDNLAVGSSGADDLDGQGGDDTLAGGKGDDTLRGHLGDDWLEGGGGADVQTGAEGDDTLLGGWGDDDLRGEAGYDRLEGGIGDDLLDGGASRDTVLGGDGNDTIRHMHGGFDIYDGGAGEDLLETDAVFLLGVEWDMQTGLYSYAPTDFTHYWTGFEHFTGSGDTSSEAVLGTSGGNLISTGNGDNRLEGRGGPDTLRGGAGRDTLDGGWGDDSVDAGDGGDLVLHRIAGLDSYDGGAGIDTIEAHVQFAETVSIDLEAGTWTDGGSLLIWAGFENYVGLGNGAEAVHGTSATNRIVAGAGDNRLYGRSGADTLIGGAGNDTLNGNVGSDWVDAGPGDDLVLETSGGVGTDINDGGAGRDTIDWSGLDFAGAVLDMAAGTASYQTAEEVMANFEALVDSSGGNTILGNDADNDIDGKGGADVISGAGGADTLAGGGGDDTVSGDEGADMLLGGWGEDVLTGGAGDDTLDGGDGQDSAAGGAGDDVYHVDRWGDVVSEDSATGGWDVVHAAAGYVLPAYVDALVLGGGGDSYGGGNGQANAITGNAGDNRLAGGDGRDTLSGTGGHDDLSGGKGRDTLDGGTGNDSLEGGDGSDLLDGGDGWGWDLLSGQGGDDTLRGGAGNDRLEGGEGADDLIGGGGDDLYILTDSLDTLVEQSGGGHDRVEAHASIGLGSHVEDVTLIGGDLDATGNWVANHMIGTTGRNMLDGSGASDLLEGRAGRDTLTGGPGNDTLHGGTGNDTLTGNDGNDLLEGNSDNDNLTGGWGDDTVTSGYGSDRIRFSQGDGHDVVTDFTLGQDELRLSQGLWSGSKTAAEVLQDHARVVGGDTWLDFDGDSILLRGVTDLLALESDIGFL